MRSVGRVVFLAVLTALAATTNAIEAVEVQGSARVYAGPTETDGEETEVRDERYSIRLLQPLTPWLSVYLQDRYNRFRSAPEGMDELERRSDEPRIDFIFRSPTVSGSLAYFERRTRGTLDTDDFDLSSFRGRFTWRPRAGLSYSLAYSDESNLADVAIFGRDIDSKTIDFDAIYNRPGWNTRYSYQSSELNNRISGFSLNQDSHDVRATLGERFWDDRLLFTMDAWLGLTEQLEENPTNDTFAEPVPAREGLFAIDTTPDIGVLGPAPELIDGDTLNPVSPPIDIGGANTFRNIGLDLGVTRPVTRIEITVDALSDAGLVWEVYLSSDNLTTSVWERIDPGLVNVVWDGSFLRYTLTMGDDPATGGPFTDRFFKAVNISTNALPIVRVTEIRALVDVQEIGRREGRATTYRAYVGANIDATERVNATINFGVSNDEDLAGGHLSRDIEEFTSDGRINVDFSPELNLSVGYRFSDVDEQLGTMLERTEILYSAALDWNPRPTANGSFSLSRRDEWAQDTLIRSSHSAQFRAGLRLLPELELISELFYNQTDDPFNGFEQSSWRLLESIVSRPTRNWTLDGTLTQTWFDSTGSISIEQRFTAQMRANWRMTPYLSWSGNWGFVKDDLQKNLSQTYSVAWNPGRKLSMSVFYQDFDSQDLRRTTSTSGSLNYRLNRSFTWFANLSRSTFAQSGSEDSEIRSLRFGFNLFF